jgi:hypothetical protein
MVPEIVDGLTVALSVTRVPDGCGPEGLTVSSVDVGVSGLTVYDTGELVEGPKFEPVDGVKAAVIESLPTGRADVVAEAVPPETATGPPMATPPTSNWTVPEAVEGVTVALSETDVPTYCGPAGVGVFSVVVVSIGLIV